MSARRVVTLTCDKPGCREHYVGGEGQNVTQVRAEATKLGGWSSNLADTARPIDAFYIDLCRFHS